MTLLKHIKSSVRLFADDCLIYHTINSPSDHLTLQEDLNRLATWAENWQMTFNTQKCSIMQMTKHHTKHLFCYTVLGHTLTLVEQHMYLGVKLDHCSYIDYFCNKANKLLGFLKNLQSCPKYFWELSYKQFIIPVLEYWWFSLWWIDSRVFPVANDT